MTSSRPGPNRQSLTAAERAQQREVRLNARRNAQRQARKNDRVANQRSRSGNGRGMARQRASLSLDSILETAIATLDREGAEKLTLRGLAADLNSGVASLYWYASGKEELMALAADELLGRALRENEILDSSGTPTPAGFADFSTPAPDPRTSEQTVDALMRLRRLILCLFAQMLGHPWLAAQLIKAGPDEHNSFMYWETVGQQLLRMELSRSQQFHASLAVINYASGMGAEIAEGAKEIADLESREEGFIDQIREWEASDPEEFPFVHAILGEFGKMDDRSQFIAGLDLLLSGLERQTWG
ncbi:TetR/AcrR family transcriptional regulator [Kocuria sp. TGY1127_2]|uniref:TetR/AcrR family transcriptional regulator n=1 Tax=Kocuria sp. TGY1127_2 TaxID=2711328 RepID=UPI001FAD77A6|nr:TetR/AcrR family transcriptional regulator C-terminal domain-containing protein [Kocuria sp. TGY1127_2]